MKQTVMPTKWEGVFHLYLWGTMMTLALVALFDFFSLLFLVLVLDFTTFGEEQIAGCMPVIVLFGWGASAIMGRWLHKRHLRMCNYDFSEKKIRGACMLSQVYSGMLYFLTIAVI